MNNLENSIHDLKIIIQRKAEFAAQLQPNDKRLPALEVELKVLHKTIKEIKDYEENVAQSINTLCKINNQRENIIEKFQVICHLHGIDNYNELLIFPLSELIKDLKRFRIDTIDGNERILIPQTLKITVNAN